MMPRMKREQFEDMSFEEFIVWARENLDDVTDEETLIQFAKEKLDDDNLGFALHILSAVYDNESDATNFRYDYTMGTLETPMPITCKEDLEDYIDFEDEEEDEFEDNDFDPDGRRRELPWDYGRHFDEEEEDA